MGRTSLPPVHVVLPGDVDDVTVASGGNTYDRRACQGLAELGRPVRGIPVPGAWPRPDVRARTVLAGALDALPDGAPVLLDGLVACGVPEVVTPRAHRLRLVVLVHLPLPDEAGLEPAEATDLAARERATLHAAHAVVATSPWAARRLSSRYGLPAARVHVVTPGTDAAPLAAGTAAGSRLLCVAAVTATKGHDVLVNALAILTHLPWTCECVGSLRRAPEFVARLRQRVHHHGLGDRVHLAGPLPPDRLAARYATTDLLVLASRVETYGMVVTEALARGVPVLATEAGGLPYTLGRAPGGRVPGMLVPPEDPLALAAALRAWLTDADLRSDLREAARDRRATLTGWDRTARELVAVLERVEGM